MWGVRRTRIIIAIAVASVLILAVYILRPPGVAEILPLDVKFVGYGTDAAGDQRGGDKGLHGGSPVLGGWVLRWMEDAATPRV